MSTDEQEGEPLQAQHVLTILAVEDLQRAVDAAAYFADPDGNVIVVAKPLPTTDRA